MFLAALFLPVLSAVALSYLWKFNDKRSNQYWRDSKHATVAWLASKFGQGSGFWSMLWYWFLVFVSHKAVSSSILERSHGQYGRGHQFPALSVCDPPSNLAHRRKLRGVRGVLFSHPVWSVWNKKRCGRKSALFALGTDVWAKTWDWDYWRFRLARHSEILLSVERLEQPAVTIYFEHSF